MSDQLPEDRQGWVRAEPGFGEWRQELMRLYRRARRRKLMTVFVAFAAAAAVCAMRWRKEQAFAASVTFRVSEGDQVSAVAPPPTKELREFVSSIALSGTKVVDVMRKHRIYLKKLDVDPVTAVQLFREDLEIEVSRNYFIEEWQTNKSARLTITYTAGSAEQASAVVNDLAQLVVDDEARRRQNTVKAAAMAADEGVAAVRHDLEQREAHLASLELALGTANRAQAAVLKLEIDNVKTQLGPVRDRFKQAQLLRDDLELAIIAEANAAGVRFDRVDESIEAITREATLKGLLLLGFVVFFLALPFAVMAVGAFDTRVYDLDDVGRLGIEPLGHVPPFRGDDVGSLRERQGG